MVKTFFHFSFTVSDIEQSIVFYRDLLGMQLVHRQVQDNAYTRQLVGYPDARLLVAQFKFKNLPATSGHVLELVQYTSPRGQKLDTRNVNIGSAHLAFLVDDADQEYERLAAHGVRFRNPPATITEGINKGGKAAYFLDPDDITLEVLQVPSERLVKAWFQDQQQSAQ